MKLLFDKPHVQQNRIVGDRTVNISVELKPEIFFRKEDEINREGRCTVQVSTHSCCRRFPCIQSITIASCTSFESDSISKFSSEVTYQIGLTLGSTFPLCVYRVCLT